MGEAKRRAKVDRPTLRIGDVVPYAGPGGETLQGRFAGSPRAFMADTARRLAAGAPAEVPCNGCNACCHHETINVDPADEPPESIAHLSLEPNPHADQVYTHPDGRTTKCAPLRLRHQDDGACIHLGPTGCTVYEYRPRSCRNFDCRVASLGCHQVSFPGGRITPVWVFDRTEPDDAALMMALEAAAKTLKPELDARGLGAMERVEHVLAGHRRFFAMARQAIAAQRGPRAAVRKPAPDMRRK